MGSDYAFSAHGICKRWLFASVLFITPVLAGTAIGCSQGDVGLVKESGQISSLVTVHPLPQKAVSKSAAKSESIMISETTPKREMFPFTVKSNSHNEIIFESPPERIVAFDSAVVEILFEIGEGHRIIGTHDFVAYPPEAVNIARVGTSFDMNIEAAVALEPDLVVVFSSSDVSSLERTGMRVLYLESLGFDFRKVSDNIRLWGGIVGNPEAADAVAEKFDSRVHLIEKKMEGLKQGQRVFQDEGDLWTPGPDTLVGEVMTLLKLQNIAHDVSGYAQLSPEIIVQRDPEIIIASYENTLSDRPAFKEVTAVKEKRVFVSAGLLSIAGPRFIDGVEALAEWVYPDLFE